MDFNEKKKDSFLSRIKNKISNISNNSISKIKMIILILSVIVIFIIFLSTLKPDDEVNIKKIENKNTLSAIEYSQTLENRLCNVLGKIKGIKNVEVFVMVDSSPTIKYLEETKEDINKKTDSETKTIQTEIVLAKNGTVSTPIVVVEIMPKITGVLVVAKGADNIKIKTMLINSISAILSVDVSKVEVMEGK